MTMVEMVSNSPDETRAIGRVIGAALAPGDVIALCGELGAGKTQLTKGLAVGLGVADERTVSSPTFVLENEYAGRCVVRHLDLYRLGDGADLSALGFEEMCDGSAVVIVEWADRARAAMPAGAVWIEMTPEGETTRRLRISGTGEPARRVAAELRMANGG